MPTLIKLTTAKCVDRKNSVSGHEWGGKTKSPHSLNIVKCAKPKPKPKPKKNEEVRNKPKHLQIKNNV